MNAEKAKNVSVVIPNYNGGRFIGQCIENVLLADPREVVVVDDGSTDNSKDEIKRFRGLAVIENERNLGPTRSRNIGAECAGGKQILFLDSDIFLDRNYISELSGFLDSDPKAGVVSGKIIESQTGERMWFNFGYDPSLVRSSFGSLIHQAAKRAEDNPGLVKLLTIIGTPLTMNFRPDRVMQVDWVVEGAFMTPTEVFKNVGGFDEQYFMFFEGPDYCRRVRQTDLQVWYTPEVQSTHLDGHSHDSSARREFQRRSQEIYYRKFARFPFEAAIANALFRYKYRNNPPQ